MSALAIGLGDAAGLADGAFEGDATGEGEATGDGDTAALVVPEHPDAVRRTQAPMASMENTLVFKSQLPPFESAKLPKL
jgi:hypothetical protein